jgi:hypothetical protein
MGNRSRSLNIHYVILIKFMQRPIIIDNVITLELIDKKRCNAGACGTQGRKAPITVEESAAGIVNLTNSLKLEHSGRFLNWRGEEMPF